MVPVNHVPLSSAFPADLQQDPQDGPDSDLIPLANPRHTMSVCPLFCDLSNHLCSLFSFTPTILVLSPFLHVNFAFSVLKNEKGSDKLVCLHGAPSSMVIMKMRAHLLRFSPSPLLSSLDLPFSSYACPCPGQFGPSTSSSERALRVSSERQRLAGSSPSRTSN